LLSADGETFVFAMCYMEREDTGATSGYELFRRRPDGTTEALGDGGALGLSTDGQRLLIYGDGAVSVVNGGGVRTVLPIPEPLSSDARITGDGVTVFGGVANGTGGRRLARWTESGGLETLGDFPLLAEAESWEIGAASHDGGVAVGSAWDGTRFLPFRWTGAGGLEELGTLPDDVGAQPTAVSADGSTIAGFTMRGGIGVDVFRWTAQDQLQILGPVVPLASFAGASTLRLSSDGARLAGAALVGGAISLVRWGTGGTVVANEAAFVTDMTADGSTLVGFTSGRTGFLWRPPVVEPTTPSSAYDLTSVATLLAQSGADGTGWALETISNISDDGRIVYGGGTCGGVPTYYRLQLAP
jgi:hypothetical protein